MEIMRKRIFIVGSLNMDLTIKCSYMPQAGETIVGGDFMTNCGGKGANQAFAAGKLGGKVAMCGCIGVDEFGKELVRNLQTVGVNTDFIREDNTVSTGIAVIVVADKDNRIILDKGANGNLTKSQIDEFLTSAEKGDIYLTQLENPIDIVGYGLKKAKEKGLYTILNPAPAHEAIGKYFSYVDLLTPNETELSILGGKEKIFADGIQTIVTTLGARGYEISTKNGERQYPCMQVNAVDTTAAGDTLCGGLAVGLAQGFSLEHAAEFGSKAASIACTRRGAARSVPTLEEVLSYME